MEKNTFMNQIYLPKQCTTCNRLANRHFLRKKEETYVDGKVLSKFLLSSRLTEGGGGGCEGGIQNLYESKDIR